MNALIKPCGYLPKKEAIQKHNGIIEDIIQKKIQTKERLKYCSTSKIYLFKYQQCYLTSSTTY